MRNGLVGLASALALASMATAGCSSGGGGGNTGGSTGSAGSSGGAGTTGAGGTSSGGNGGTGGGASAVTTISGTTAVNALTPAQVTQLCDDTYSYFGSAIPKATTCKWRGLAYAASSSAPTDAQVVSNCTMKETACQGTDPWADNLGCNEIPSTCTATVAEYSACISDEVAGFIQTVNGLKTCAMLTRADTPALFDVMTAPLPASCMSLMNKCADLYPPGPLNQ